MAVEPNELPGRRTTAFPRVENVDTRGFDALVLEVITLDAGMSF